MLDILATSGRRVLVSLMLYVFLRGMDEQIRRRSRCVVQKQLCGAASKERDEWEWQA